MFPGQLEWYPSVIEIGSKAVQAIVARHAVAPEILGVGLHEGRLDLSVTGAADGFVETCVDLDMAIVTSKLRPVSSSLVAGQYETKRIVRKGGITEVN